MNLKIKKTDAKKIFDKIQHASMIKILEGIGPEGASINIIKAIYDKPQPILL